MQILDRLSIRARLLLITGCAILLMFVGTAIAVWAARASIHHAEQQVAVTGWMRAQQEAQNEQEALRGGVLLLLGDETGAELEKAARAEIKERVASLNAVLAKLQAQTVGEAFQADVVVAAQAVATYTQAAEAVAAAGDEAARREARKAFDKAHHKSESMVWKLGEGIDKAVVAHTEEAHAQSKAVIVTLIVASVAGALALLALTITISLGIARMVRRVTDEAENLKSGDGDLTRRLPDLGGEFGALCVSFNGFIEKLAHTLLSVRGSAQAISVSSTEIAQGNQDLSSRTEQQSSSLQETTASLGQMTSTVKQNADAAKQASQLASSASEVAARGGAVVADVVERMGEIQASSRKIAEIIGVIDGIAFQTNILALNAAVEAARAGEQGRGFAVVAGEVRNLAQRSAQAAREIKSLISDSVEKVESGSKLVHDAGQTMSDIVSQVRRVTDLIGEITSATLEQNTGIEQINQAVGHLDQMTQQNAALVEQSAAASESLREQAAVLAQVVSNFRLDDGAPATAVAAPAPRSVGPKPAPATPAPAAAAAPAPRTAPVPVRPSPAAETPAAPRPSPAPSSAASAPRVSAAATRAADDWEEF